MKLIMLKGFPASGKSTKAKEILAGGGEYFRVNRDLLRTMLHNDIWSHKREKVTIDTQKMVAIQLLIDGKNVIIDDTNLSQKHEDIWKGIATEVGAKFEVIDMMKEVTVAECIKRNKERPNAVPSGVIENMALQYNALGLKKIVVCDIDGTVADGEHRQNHLQGEKKDWKAYFAEMHNDIPRKDIYEKAMDEAVAEGAELIFVSARPEDYRKETEKWLKKHGMDYMNLVMRRKGDKRPDTDVKGEIYNRYLKQYEIVKVFDDRPVVIRMWQALGLEVEDCGNGVEF